MDFLLDVNASGAVVRWLIDRGHNVAEVGQKDPRMSDDEILSWAVRERRIIVTTDNDFEEMIWRQGKSHCGVLRFENLPRSPIISQVIGESVKQIQKTNPSFLQRYAEIEWDKIARFRDLVSHHYEHVDHEVVYDICNVHIPKLGEVIQRMRIALSESGNLKSQ